MAVPSARSLRPLTGEAAEKCAHPAGQARGAVHFLPASGGGRAGLGIFELLNPAGDQRDVYRLDEVLRRADRLSQTGSERHALFASRQPANTHRGEHSAKQLIKAELGDPITVQAVDLVAKRSEILAIPLLSPVVGAAAISQLAVKPLL